MSVIINYARFGDFIQNYEDIIEDHVKTVKSIDKVSIDFIASKICECFEDGNKLVLFGNGGSATDADHIAAEFVGKFRNGNRVALPALSLPSGKSQSTAIPNDWEFDYLFERELEAYVVPNDVLLGITTSGNSPNVIRGLKKGKELEAYTIVFTGTGGKVLEVADYALKVNSKDTPRIQEAHITAGHIICEFVESKLYNKHGKTMGLPKYVRLSEEK